jgi:hypothetical protein
MNRRNGTTLIEVLVSIFVMGIGLIALFTLFPIGALRIGQSIHNDKSTLACGNAWAMAIGEGLRTDPLVVKVPASTAAYGDSDFPNGVPDVFLNPYPNGSSPNADPFSKSYAVVADPVGYFSVGGASKNWVGGVPGLLRRRPVQYIAETSTVNTFLNTYRTFTLWDDISFDSREQPGTPQHVGNTVFREYRFSWLYLLRRPMATQNPQTSKSPNYLPNLADVVDCSIVVFDRRPLSMTGNLILPEYVYANKSYFDPTRNTITIDYTNNVPPPIRPGNWILDATIVNNPSPPALPNTVNQHAYFYRVVAVTDITNTMVQYEVQTPLRDWPATPPPSPGFQGTAIIMDGVAEVFEKGPIRIQ